MSAEKLSVLPIASSVTSDDYIAGIRNNGDGTFTNYIYPANDVGGGGNVDFQPLTPGATINWAWTDAKKGATVTLSVNSTLVVTGTSDGSCGVVKVKQGTGGQTLALQGAPPTSYALSTGAGEVDTLYFIQIGGVLYWSITNHGVVVEPTPTLVADWLAANGITDPTVESAWTNYISGLNSAGLLSKARAGFQLANSFNESKYSIFDITEILTQVGSGTFAADGFTNTSGSALDGLYTGQLDTAPVTICVSVKSDTAATACDMGSIGANQSYIISRTAALGSDAVWFVGGDVSGTGAFLHPVNSNGIGRYTMVNRGTTLDGFKNGAQLDTCSKANNSTGTAFIIGNGGDNTVGGGLPSTRKIALAFVFDELTDAEVATHDALWATLETDLGI